MAFQIYRSAAADQGDFGRAGAYIQQGINFNDVKSEGAARNLLDIAKTDFIARANIAKQALGELGATKRDQMLLAYQKDRDDNYLDFREQELAQIKKNNKMTALLNMLGGGGMQAADALQLQKNNFFADPRQEMLTQTDFAQGLANRNRNRLNSTDAALNTALQGLGMSATGGATPVVLEVKNPATPPPKLEGAQSKSAIEQIRQLVNSLGRK